MIRTFILGLVLAALPALASAATLSLSPATSTLSAGQDVTIYLAIHSDTSVNTIGTAVILPEGLVFLSTTKGDVIQDWVDQPAYDAAHRSLAFSGIVPNGWQGTGTLLAVTARAQKAGSYSLQYDGTQTEVYRNDGQATPEPVAFGTIGSSNNILPPLIGVIVVIILLLWLYLRRHKVYVRFV